MDQVNGHEAARRRAAGVAVVVAVGLVAWPAAANAGSKVYAGTTAGGGQIAMDVTVKKGKPKRIKEIRYKNLPANCAVSGPLVVWGDTPALDLRVSKKGKFSGSLQQPVYGNVSSIAGKFKGKGKRLATGTFSYSYHFEADAEYPEEDCTSADEAFEVVRGAADVIPGPPSAASLRR